MANIECQNCAMEIESHHTNCPICGEKLDKPNKWIQWVAIALVLVLLYAWLK